MATITDELVLDVTQPLRQFDSLEFALDQSVTSARRLTTEMGQTEKATAGAAREAEQFQATLREVERIASRSATEIASVELAAGRAEANFEDVARALNISEEAARGLAREVIDAQAAANRLEDSARDVARQLGLSEEETRRFANSLARASREADDINVRTNALVGTFGSLRTAAAGLAGVIAGLGLGQAVQQVVQFGVTATRTAIALADSADRAAVTFGNATTQVRSFASEAAEALGLSERAALDAANRIGLFTTELGIGQAQAAQFAEAAVQVAAGLSLFADLAPEEAVDAVIQGLAGRGLALKQLGVDLSTAAIQAKAADLGLSDAVKAGEAAALVQTRLALIVEGTTQAQAELTNTNRSLADSLQFAAAQGEDFAASVGDVLAPAIADVVALLPDLLEGLRQLVPAFAAGADSAADFFASLGEGGGFRTEFASLRAGFDIVTGGAGLAAEAGSVFAAGLKGDFAGVAQAAQRGGVLIERAFTRGIAVNLANALDKGEDSLTAFKTAIQQTASSSSALSIFTGNFRDFAIAAGLSQVELRDVTSELISNADQIGLTSQEVQFLNEQLTQLNGLLAVDTRRRGPFQAIAEVDFETTTTRFATFVSGVEDGTDRAATALAELAAAAERQQARTSAAFDLFAELPEKIKGSFTVAVDALREQVESIAGFEINIAILRALNLDALADEFQTQGIAAAGQLEQAINNIPEAIEADRLLQGLGAIGEDAFNALVEKFISSGLTPADARRLAEELSSPEVIAAATEAGKSVGAAQGEAYHDSLTESVDQLIPEVGSQIGDLVSTHWRLEEEARDAGGDTGQSFIDGIIARVTPDSIKGALGTFGLDINLTDEGVEAGITLITGMVIGVRSGTPELADAVENTTRNALQMNSPSELMLALGRQAGNDLITGFAQSANRPIPVLTGMQIGGAGGVSPSPNVTNFTNQNIINNPVARDILSESARLEQLTGAVTSNLRGF